MWTKFIVGVLGLDIPDSSACVLLCACATWIVFLYLITFSVFLFYAFSQSTLEPMSTFGSTTSCGKFNLIIICTKSHPLLLVLSLPSASVSCSFIVILGKTVNNLYATSPSHSFCRPLSYFPSLL